MAAQGFLAASSRSPHRGLATRCTPTSPPGLLVGELQAAFVEALRREPALVRLRPGGALPDEPLAQEQLGEPVAGAHEVGAGILAGAHQVAGGLLGEAGHAHRRELAEAQQLGQPQGVAAVGLDALARSAGDLRGGGHQAGDPRRLAGARQAEAGGPGLVGDRDRLALGAQPGDASARTGAVQLLTSPLSASSIRPRPIVRARRDR